MQLPLLPPKVLAVLDTLHLRVPLRTIVFAALDFYQRLKIPIVRHAIKKREAELRTELLAKKRKISVWFVCLDKSQWIFQSVYDALSKQSIFNLKVFICPTWIRNNDPNAQNELMSFFSDRNVPTVSTLPPSDLPDIMFVPRFDALAFGGAFSLEKLYKKVLLCGQIYAWITPDCDQAYFGKLEEMYLWKYFVFNQRDACVCKSFNIIPDNDIVITGFPRNDEFDNAINETAIHHANQTVTIIWAPHWTVLTHSRFGNFDRYAYPLLNWLKRHPNVRIILKPHPLLRARLTDPETIDRFSFNNPNFQTPSTFSSAKEYDAFMAEWDALPNGGVMNSGGYAKLFAESDAMLLDSGSFLAEYMYFNKPMCFCNRDRTHDELMTVYNDFGRDLFNGIQIADDIDDVFSFLNDVIHGVDKLRCERETIRAKYLCTNAGHVGDFICDCLVKNLIGK